MFKFQSSIAEDEVFVDHSDKMLSSEEESIKLATGDAFLKTYTESLFKKYGRAEVTSITAHLETISNDMITNGYCSPNGKQIVKQSIAESSGFRHGAYVFNGMMVNRLIGDYYNLPSNDIGLLLAGF